jgi:hypothetical protein
MVYAIVGLALATFGMIIWMAVWVSRLKGEIQKERDRASLWEGKHSEQGIELKFKGTEIATLKTQLNALRTSYKEVVDALEAGGGDVADFAARLRDGLS